MLASLNNLGFTSCVFQNNLTPNAQNTNLIIGDLKRLLPKLKLQYQLKEATGQPGKFAELTTTHNSKEYKFFLFQSKENNMDAIKIVPEADGFNLNNIHGEFSKNLHKDLQRIARTIHKSSNADLTFSVEPEFSPNNPDNALEQAQSTRHLIIGRSLAKPIVNRMQTLSDGSIEIMSNDNPAIPEKQKQQVLQNMPGVLMKGLMDLKQGFQGIFKLAA
jgi:hypothetical protein